jgi:translation initiation factor IF-1
MPTVSARDAKKGGSNRMGRTAAKKYASNSRRAEAVEADELEESQDFACVVKARGYSQMTVRCRNGSGEVLATISGVLKGGRGTARLRTGSIVLVERLGWDEEERSAAPDATYRIMAAFDDKQITKMRKGGVLPEWMLRKDDMSGGGAAAAAAVEPSYLFEEEEAKDDEIDVDAI